MKKENKLYPWINLGGVYWLPIHQSLMSKLLMAITNNINKIGIMIIA
jgi:hypothetical protein